MFTRKMSFNDLLKEEAIYLYAGDVPRNGLYEKFVGLSLTQANSQHIKHDVTKRLPLKDCCVDIYQSEDVFEHIEPKKLITVIDEIYRVLKPGGIFRLSLPDYQCDILRNRTLKSKEGKLLFDPGGGGDFEDGKVVNGGHLWFPEYNSVKSILDRTLFKEINFYHYYNEDGEAVTNTIDYSVGHVMRTPDHDERVRKPYRPMSIVVDCMK
ncbi:class I SAM-dependent methyltransferase [Gilvimarinus sp. SDUM040013]|uniref:Class I SAM-dependent methyltransferase n=1 Tax=Gilvimarinus gilvus TaxID=3058038 RepID=A0ABU4S2P6_9GAMM|nr:class I SAM-dependent methyltransferase [Gilvimarinus sp. SDUM040013]MDO3385439.1 class I SAM-dependent methyltransferase [Gilvimarinus sp. SDUM040013]MDX6851300.1 class I SAM-dependent methyltransferase [Gilvimarinus sp. SDUM040013]